ATQGRVLRSDGVTPAVGIPVYTRAGGMVTTDAQGFWRVENVRVGSIIIRALDEANLEQATVHTTIVANSTITANLLLFGGTGTVRGIVLDAENNPVVGAQIYGGFDLALTDAQGEFVLSSLPLTTIRLTAVDEASGLVGKA